jgi:uncharacterized protein YndB with AHSA1/START domain
MTQAATRELIISRVFDAPRPLVYRAFVDPDQLAQWFGPVGYSVPRDTVQIDARPGGREHYVMMNQGDRSVCHTIDSIFTEVIENEVLAGYQDELAWRSGLRRCAGCVRCVPLARAAPIPVAATAYRDPPPKRSDLSR